MRDYQGFRYISFKCDLIKFANLKVREYYVK